ncbi:MAG: serine/threonine-protein kinase [Gemmatimonadota bacterium]
MDPRRWDRIEQLSLEALGLEPDDRRRFLDEACRGDRELLYEVQTLLVELERDSPFLTTPLIEVGRLLPDDAAFEPMGRAGEYRLIRPIGRGGMGEVFLAKSVAEDAEQTVAVKIIRKGMDSDDVVARFGTERRILAQLQHPNIGRLYTSGVMADGRPYYVMEYVQGEPIDEYCDARRLSVSDRLRLFLEVCDAVQHAHQNLVVHRDIKPKNVLVDQHGAPKLLDFGIAKVLEPDPDESAVHTATGIRVLTPEFAAPEQLLGGTVTAATDCFGLGVLLHLLLTGGLPERPAQAEGEAAHLSVGEPVRPSRLVDRDAPEGSATSEEASTRSSLRDTDPRSLRRTLAGDLDTIVLKALQSDTERRYPSVHALADDIDRYLRGRPILARPDSVSYRARKFVRRNAWAAVAGAVAFGGMASFAVQDVRRDRAVAAERDRAVEVRDFLLEAFGATGADQASADSVSVRQLLDRQAESLDDVYGDRPRLRAEMLGVLAEGYQRIGLYDEAADLARRSLDLRVEEYGGEHAEVASARGLLGWIRFEQGAFEVADSILAEATRTWRRLGRGEEQGLARALNDWGVVLDRLGYGGRAEDALSEALAIRIDLSGPDDRSVAVTASNLAAAAYRRGDYPAAAEMGERALTALQNTVGPDHQRSFVAQSNLAVFRWVQGDQEGAEAAYQDLLERQHRVLGPAHPVSLTTQQALATFYEGTGRRDDAIEQLEGILEVRRAALGPDHPDVAETLETLGGTYARAEDHVAALDVLMRALEIKQATFGTVHEEVAEALGNVGSALRRAGRSEEAVGWLQRSVDVGGDALGEEHRRVADIRLRLASTLFELERLDEAFVQYSRTYAASRDRPPTSILLNTSRLQMASIHLTRGQVVAADSLIRATEVALGDEADGHEVEDLLARTRARLDSIPGGGADG